MAVSALVLAAVKYTQYAVVLRTEAHSTKHTADLCRCLFLRASECINASSLVGLVCAYPAIVVDLWDDRDNRDILFIVAVLQ